MCKWAGSKASNFRVLLGLGWSIPSSPQPGLHPAALLPASSVKYQGENEKPSHHT